MTWPGQRCGSWRYDEHPGKISYYFNRSTSEAEYHQSSACGVSGAWCSKDFHRDQEAADVDFERGELEKGGKRKQSDGRKEKKKNRRMKEILILSERVLIFSSGLAMCAQLVISLEKKNGMTGLCVSVCMLVFASPRVLFDCFSSLWEFLLPQRCHLCMYEFVVYVQEWVGSFVWRPGCWTAVWARVLWSPWLVGDAGIRGRLKWWLHNVFALMIPTVCSSYQLCCTGFHVCRWYEITHRLLSYLWPFSP